MFLRWTVAVGVALVLAGSSFATDALAKGEKAKKTLAAKPAKNKKTPTSNAPVAQTGSTALPTAPNTNSNFGANGPYVGLKWVGDVP